MIAHNTESTRTEIRQLLNLRVDCSVVTAFVFVIVVASEPGVVPEFEGYEIMNLILLNRMVAMDIVRACVRLRCG